jgi:hypothetical protein
VGCDRDYGDVGGFWFWLSCVVSVVVPVVELVLPFASVVVVVVVLLLPDVVSVDVDIAPLGCVPVVVSVSRMLWLQPAAKTASVSAAASGAILVMDFMSILLGVEGRRRRPQW